MRKPFDKQEPINMLIFQKDITAVKTIREFNRKYGIKSDT